MEYVNDDDDDSMMLMKWLLIYMIYDVTYICTGIHVCMYCVMDC